MNKATTFLRLMAVLLIVSGISYLYLNQEISPTKFEYKQRLNRTPNTSIIEKTEQLDPTPKKNIEQTKANTLIKESHKNNNVPKYIVHWYGSPYVTNQPILDHQLPESCGGCKVTANRTKINSTPTRAVIFFFRDIALGTMPKERNPDQYYVYFTQEGPKHVQKTRPNLKDFDGIFNLTMSYKRNSDIYRPYYMMSDVLRQLKNKYKHTQDSGITLAMQAKKRFAVWIVSNCNGTPGSAKRFKLVEKMVQAGIDIDRRGKCFPNNPPPPGRGNSEVEEFMASSKFYIAFENSHHCKDYITEKVYRNSFLAGSVPIVWGPIKEDYKAVLPPHSFICMDDFENNMTKLADYLNYLDRNDTAYKEYLSWRLMDVKDMYGYGKSMSTCHLCEFMNGINAGKNPTSTHENYTSSSEQIPRRIVESLVDWTFSEEEPECTL